MLNSFSQLEVSLVKKMNGVESPASLAEWLGKPETSVLKLMHDLGLINEYEKKVRIAEERRKKQEAVKLKSQERVLRREIETNRIDARRKAREPLFVTKPVDYSQMETVKVNSKTWLIVKPGTNHKTAIKNYRSK